MERSKDIFLDQMQGEQADAEEQFFQEQYAVQRTVNIFEQGLTKEDIPVLAKAMVNHILETGNPLEAAENMRLMEMLIDAIKGDNGFKDYALEELTKYGKSYTSERGVKIELAEVGGRYDYKTCGDPVVIELEKKLKERQEFLKKLPKEGIEIRHEDELIHIYPPAKPATTTTYKITLPK